VLQLNGKQTTILSSLRKVWQDAKRSSFFTLSRKKATHIKWCKERARESLEGGKHQEAYSSFIGNLERHPETAKEDSLQIGRMLKDCGHMKTKRQVKDFVEGY